MSTQYLGDKPNEGAIRIVTSLNGKNGDIIVNQQTLGFDKEIINKSDVGHEHNYADSATAGGSATSAEKLTTDDGTTNNPVYFGSRELSFVIPRGWMLGDVNFDGVINSEDSDELFNYVLGGNFTQEEILKYDINRDGNVDVYDLQKLYSFITGSGQIDLLDIIGNWETDGSQFYTDITIDGIEKYNNVSIVLPRGTPHGIFSSAILTDKVLRIYATKLLKQPLGCYVLESQTTQFLYEGEDISSSTFPFPIKYTIEKSVPSDAQFTDTTYNPYENGNAGLIKLYDSFGDNTDGAMTQEAINNVSSTMAGQSVSVNETLLASNWSGTSIPYKYELELDGVTESSNQEIMPANDITDEQLYYMQGANLQDGGQSIGKIILNAFAVKPPIDIPIKIIMRKD